MPACFVKNAVATFEFLEIVLGLSSHSPVLAYSIGKDAETCALQGAVKSDEVANPTAPLLVDVGRPLNGLN